MSEMAYALLEEVALIIDEMQDLVDCCNAEESVAVLQCIDDLHTQMPCLYKILANYRMALGDDDGDDDQ